MSKSILVVTNAPDSDVAYKMARKLLEGKLAACVNVLPSVLSIYRWQGAIEEAVEVTLFIKTSDSLYRELEATIVELHPYDVPEIIALPISAGLPAYLAWIDTETRKD